VSPWSCQYAHALQNPDRLGPPRDFSYSRDLRADGYAGAVVQMDHLLGQIADLIIEALDD
jgi:hypothetical protein